MIIGKTDIGPGGGAKNQQIAKTPAPTTIARTAEAHKYARKNAGAESGGNNKKTKLPVILD